MQNLYKDKSLLQTISNIKNFFTYNNYFKIEENSYKSEIGTFTTSILLMKDDIFLLKANGKGITKEESLASGYAELYERFCNKIEIYTNPILSKKLFDLNYSLNNYYLDPNEKILTFDEAFSIDSWKKIKSIFNTDRFKDYYTKLYDNLFVGIPYYNIFNHNDLKYLDPRITYNYNSSSGMVAGNTFEEALNQGLSELCEHHIINQIFHNQYKQLYALDKSCIYNETILEYLEKIENSGNEITIIDFSYNSNLPVIGIILYNKKFNLYNINVGSFPIFEVALERVITEIYQGIVEFNIDNKKFLIPNLDDTNIIQYILNNKTYIKTYNKNIFCTDYEVSNLELNNYFKNLFNKLNINVYCYNNSLSQNIYALSLYSPDLKSKFVFEDIKLNKNESNLLLDVLDNNLIINKSLLNGDFSQLDLEHSISLIKKFFNTFNNLLWYASNLFKIHQIQFNYSSMNIFILNDYQQLFIGLLNSDQSVIINAIKQICNKSFLYRNLKNLSQNTYKLTGKQLLFEYIFNPIKNEQYTDNFNFIINFFINNFESQNLYTKKIK